MKPKATPGKRIIELCKTYSMNMEILAEKSGLPLEMIKRITEEDHIPDLAPLFKISHALGVRLGTLLDDYSELGPTISRADGGAGTNFTTSLPSHRDDKDTAQGFSFKTLAADKSGRHMEPFIVSIESDSEYTQSSHEGEEFIYVLQGKLALKYGSETHTLNQGDSVYYDSIVPHNVFSADGNQTRILAVLYTPA
jgi:quercetin dioxygenase-like cupin family protein